MTDTRYLKRRGGRWWFQIAVPVDLQPVIGKQTITKSLKTSDTRTAQNARWEHVASWKAAFGKARNGQGLTADEIEAEAQAEYRRLAANMIVQPNVYHQQAAGQTGDPLILALSDSIHDNLADLEDGDYSRVEKQVQEIIERTGAALDKNDRWCFGSRGRMRHQRITGVFSTNYDLPFFPGRADTPTLFYILSQN